MEKEKTINKIQNEIIELTSKKDRYVIWVKQELTLIKSYAEDEDIWSATRTLKAHIDKIEQYKATILATECRIDSSENADDFNQEASFDLDFNELELVRIDTETMEYAWEWLDEWDPEKLTIITHVFSTPAGDITVMTPEYEDESEEMTPDFLMSSVVYENGEEVERHEN